ncbi:MAG: hypothetical protein KKG06_00775 [Bacteroidetes bacterium]|nr:hypothetical protein [Bacteroidota bacterium]
MRIIQFITVLRGQMSLFHQQHLLHAVEFACRHPVPVDSGAEARSVEAISHFKQYSSGEIARLHRAGFVRPSPSADG